MFLRGAVQAQNHQQSFAYNPPQQLSLPEFVHLQLHARLQENATHTILLVVSPSGFEPFQHHPVNSLLGLLADHFVLRPPELPHERVPLPHRALILYYPMIDLEKEICDVFFAIVLHPHMEVLSLHRDLTTHQQTAAIQQKSDLNLSSLNW